MTMEPDDLKGFEPLAPVEPDHAPVPAETAAQTRHDLPIGVRSGGGYSAGSLVLKPCSIMSDGGTGYSPEKQASQ